MAYKVRATLSGRTTWMDITIRDESDRFVAGTNRQATVAGVAEFFNEFGKRWNLSDQETVELLISALQQMPRLPAGTR